MKKFDDYLVWKTYVDMHMPCASTVLEGKVTRVKTKSGDLIAWFIRSEDNGAVIDRRLVDREFSDI